MKNRTLSQCSFVHTGFPQLSAVCLVLSMGLALGPAIAAQTNPPVPIHGRAPTATGKLILQMQEVPGVTLSIVDNTLVSGAKKPNEFTFTPVPGSIFTDADGDARGTSGTLGLSVAPSGAVWTWKGAGRNTTHSDPAQSNLCHKFCAQHGTDSAGNGAGHCHVADGHTDHIGYTNRLRVAHISGHSEHSATACHSCQWAYLRVE
ncbi:Uncharacterised protein [Budvicia aquatica]|uniref:Uncharacterized protein n=1 Tax=Budvicia aquatica TaxID=82979 RepID=A0A484ZW04_9GAMM|nr:Uncharacterised protein [Budvicia aquatica]